MFDIPLSLYVHFPWCIKKCPYCDFNSHAVEGAIPEQAYLSRLMEDLEDQVKPDAKTGARLYSIFLGGGTPSLFTPDAIACLLNAVAEWFAIDNIEITLEANPGGFYNKKQPQAFEADRFAGYRQAGVNRLSIGAQSFNDDALKTLGRIHQSADILRAFDDARRAGFDNINLDVMHGLPGQSVKAAMQDLDQAFSLAPEHISWYQLTIEKNTHFYRYPPVLPDEDRLFAIGACGAEQLDRQGYAQYEVSAFARSGRRAVHNLNYWQFGDYLGIGAGAHGKISGAGGITRTSKSRAPKDYLQGGQTRVTQVPESDIATEFLMNALRLNEGFSRKLFENRTGLPWQSLACFLAAGESRGLLKTTPDNSRVQTTSRGQRLLDELLLLAP